MPPRIIGVLDVVNNIFPRFGAGADSTSETTAWQYAAQHLVGGRAPQRDPAISRQGVHTWLDIIKHRSCFLHSGTYLIWAVLTTIAIRASHNRMRRALMGFYNAFDLGESNMASRYVRNVAFTTASFQLPANSSLDRINDRAGDITIEPTVVEQPVEKSMNSMQLRSSAVRALCGQSFGKNVRLVLTLMVTLMSIGSAPTAYAICCLEEPPATPTGFTGPSEDPAVEYTISWNSSIGASFYELQEKVGSGNWTTIYSSYLLAATFSKDVVESYSYRVAACSNAEGCSSYTSAITVDFTGGIDTDPAEEEENYLTVGTTPYGIDVAGAGDALISVPIKLIPGVAGFAPSLSLKYDSGRGIDLIERSLPEDTLGYGWRLAGLSQIRRCVVNQSTASEIELDTGDSLCLGGMPLVLASGTHFSVGAVYRTLIESYIKFEIKGTSGALWFEVKLPDGTVQEYGNSGGSRVDDDGGVDFQWSLSKETSPDDNVINYGYWHDPSNGVNRISRIDYTDATAHFRYRQRSDALPVSIGTGSDSQTQNAFLHTISVEYDDTLVREYRLIDEVDSGSRRRLEMIQQCGYDENGTNVKCLKPLVVTWDTSGSTTLGVPIYVTKLSDSLGAVHEYTYGTITDTSHPAEFTEEPFGEGEEQDYADLLPGSGPLRHVVTKLRRDDGLPNGEGELDDDDFHVTTYAYQERGLSSTIHWGFLGFYAQRITDEESGVVTYVQYRHDFPFFGRVSEIRQYDGVFVSTATLPLTRSTADYAQESISHGTNSSAYPFVETSINFVYEGSTALGGTITFNDPSFSSGFISGVVTTTKTGDTITSGAAGSGWGDIDAHSVTDLINRTETTVDFRNSTTTNYWTIGFPDYVTTESWPGAASGDSIVQNVDLNPAGDSLRPVSIERFPNDPALNVSTGFGYQSLGRLTSISVSGDNIASRATSIALTFVDDRYPSSVTNPKNQTTTYSAYDSRFGTVKTKGAPNSRNSNWVRDEFGRVVTYTNADDVVTTTTYSDCPTGCPSTVYEVVPRFKAQTTTIGSSTTVAPIRNTYFDNLGRVIRTETESFSGASYGKKDTKYDELGQVERYSLPYYTGTSNDVVPEYDIRGRVKKMTRPDNSVTNIEYAASSGTVIVTITDTVKSSADDITQVKENEYNILGQLTKTTDGYGTSIDPSTTYTYDANGNLIKAEVSDGSDTIATEYEYDAAGNQKKIIDPDMGTITSTYTGLGELGTRTDAKSQLSTYTYDLLGRLTTLANTADGTSTWVWDTATNGVGKLKSRSKTDFTETYSYNSASRLSTIVTNITPIGGSSGTNYTTSHDYDNFGRPTDTTYPGGFVKTRVYNARGYLSQLEDDGTAIQTIASVDPSSQSVDGIDAFGNITNISYV